MSLAGSPSARAPGAVAASPSTSATRTARTSDWWARTSRRVRQRPPLARSFPVDFSVMPDTNANGANLTGTGLEGVSLGRTEIALVDGQNGRLVYRGHDAERLAEEHTFEQVAYLLWHGNLPSESELAGLHERLVAGMAVPSEVHEMMRALL